MAKRDVLSRKIAYPYFVLVGALFVFCCKTCGDLQRDGNILWTGSYVAGVLALSLLLGGMLGAGACFLLYRAAQSGAKAQSVPEASRGSKLTAFAERFANMGNGRFFALSFGLILLSFVPAFLACYPGICAYDTIYQLDQVVENYLIEHHPLVHTLLLKGFFLLGTEGLNSANAGIALYVVLQMLLLSFAFSLGLAVAHAKGVKWYWQLLGLIYSVCYPFHHFLGVSVTKDTVFSGFFLVGMVLFFLLLEEGRNASKPGWKDGALFVAIIGITLFRNNGKYALLVLVVFLVFALLKGRGNRKLWGRLLLVSGAALLAGQLILTSAFRLGGAEQGDKREMLSMPIQQMARTMIYHGGVGVLEEDDNTMSDVDKALVNDFLLNEAYKKYSPILADPVKGNTNTYVVRYRTMEFIKTYFSLLTAYPGDFINAGLAVNAGYLNPGDVTHSQVYEQEGAVGEGYVQMREMTDTLAAWNVYKDSKIPGLYDVMLKWADENAYLKVPVLKYFFVPGIYVWLYLVLAGYLLICKKCKYLLPLAMVLGYFVTLLLGPTVQLRYLYPLMITLPFYTMISCGCGKETEENDR